MIQLRPVASDGDYEAFAHVKNVVVSNEPTTAEEVRRGTTRDRLLLLAELDGALVGAGIAGRSNFGGRAFLAARVLPPFRHRGVGRALVAALAAHARSLGLEGVNAFVDARDERSVAFARSYALEIADVQLEQVRTVGDEPPPRAPDGVVLAPLGADREAVLREAWPVAEEGYSDMPLPGVVHVPIEEWLRDEATLPYGSFVARSDGAVVGYAGLLERAEEGTAEHGLTVVRRDRRGSGIGRALKQAELHWAARNGIRQLVTWTQRGNEAMQALNRALGYVDREKVFTFQGPLP